VSPEDAAFGRGNFLEGKPRVIGFDWRCETRKTANNTSANQAAQKLSAPQISVLGTGQWQLQGRDVSFGALAVFISA